MLTNPVTNPTGGNDFVDHKSIAQAIKIIMTSALQPNELSDLVVDMVAADGSPANYPRAYDLLEQIRVAATELVEILPSDDASDGS